jgi:hypothetical protein
MPHGTHQNLKEKKMFITRQSQWSGITRTLDIPVTHEQLYEWQQRGAMIQNAMPNLTAAQREFLMTGVTEEEWKEMWGKEDEDA